MLVISSKRSLEHAVKKTRKILGKKSFVPNELHAYHASDLTRVRMLKKLNAVDDLSIYCIILDKTGRRFDRRQTSHERYCVACELLIKVCFGEDRGFGAADTTVVIDKRNMKKEQEGDLRDRLKKLLTASDESYVSVTFRESHNEKSLQAADFIAWSIFRKYEYGDDKFYERIRPKIIVESRVE